jgi:cardiolipin synthase
VSWALLRWDQKLSRVPEPERGWRQAVVIAGAEWRELADSLVSDLTPKTPGHGAYYQAFLADRLLYRDDEGSARFAFLGEQPQDVVIEHRFSIEETLEVVARLLDAHLARTHPGGSLFLLMAPNARRFAQPLLVDRQQRRCILLAPAALYDNTEQGFTLSATAQSLSAVLLESHVIALIKNPVSSAARLGDVVVQSLKKFVRLPLPKPVTVPAEPGHPPGMDLAGWEAWLDRYTGTRREAGSIRLLIDGDAFFSRFHQAIAEATNHIHLNVYVFDRDDVGVSVANQLKQRSREDIEIKVIFDRVSTLTSGQIPPGTPMPDDFVPPASISSWLRKDSRVQVRPFLNPWFSSDHAKVLIVDGWRAWLGGMNMGREYRYEWHDMMFEVEGEVVTSLEHEFRRMWAHEGPLGDAAYLAALLSEPQPGVFPLHSTEWYPVRRLPTKTAWKPFAAAVLSSLARARSYIYVENPYLFDKRVILGLVKARARGVDVRVVLPRVNDVKAGTRGNLVIANYLRERGVRVYFYPGMTHVKALQVDGWSCLGSANLNHLSLRVNQEQNLATSDPGFATQLKTQLFETDFARSYELKEPIAVDWVDFITDLVLEGL